MREGSPYREWKEGEFAPGLNMLGTCGRAGRFDGTPYWRGGGERTNEKSTKTNGGKKGGPTTLSKFQGGKSPGGWGGSELKIVRVGPIWTPWGGACPVTVGHSQKHEVSVRSKKPYRFTT